MSLKTFFLIFGGHKVFLWSHCVLDFWRRLLWVSKPEWAALFALDRGVCLTHSMRLTCGVTLADLLAAQNLMTQQILNDTPSGGCCYELVQI